MTIYNQIDSNRTRTWVIMAIFILFVVAVVMIFTLAMGMPLEAAPIAGGIALIVAGLVSFLSYYKSDSLVLGIAKAKEIAKEDNQELYNTVENLCIGSGIPTPKIYIIDDSAPNAFATGRDPKHSAIAVTSGLLDKLDKLELEGVIAHELSHVGNYDIRLMSITVVLVGMVALLADLFLRWTWFGAGRRSSNKGLGGNLGIFILVAAVVAAILAPIGAQLIRLAVSRRRESLADASAALLTRYPEGLANALEKISADKEPLEVANKATAHLYIINPLKEHASRLNNLFATHPPVEERIAALRAM